jgi:glucosamine--fructose-6-phosphate aminotransferase (isomerizing)
MFAYRVCTIDKMREYQIRFKRVTAMCGIVGYIGDRNVVRVLVDGLKRLEYRGYDSAGIALADGPDIRVVKSLGKLSALEAKLDGAAPGGAAGIGHTRWATHGRPSEQNAHPHFDCPGRISVVHNGIIENFQSLKDRLTARGHIFTSETDTEVVAHLLEEHYRGSIEEALRQVLKELKGSYALGILCRDEPGVIVAARRDSPLIIGLGEGETFLASDIPAFLDYTRRALLLQDGEIAVVTREGARLTDSDGSSVTRDPVEILWDSRMAEKSGYRHFMLKEIHEQPRVVADTLRGRIDGKWRVVLDELNLKAKDVARIRKIFIIACGTALHAGIVGKYLMEEILRIPVEIDMASEFRYRRPILDRNSLLVAVSQSGETADTLAAVREGKRQGAQVVAVTNVVGSTITREVDGILYTRAGPEIGVAATKTFTAQMVAMYLLTFYIAQKKRVLPDEARVRYLQELASAPDMIEEILSKASELRNIARKFHQCRDFLFLGRNINYPIALEGALKLKEISYIHAEGYAAGEMKHGPIALVDHKVPIVAVATRGEILEKMVSNIKEVKAREAVTIGIATRGDEEAHRYLDYPFFVPPTSEILSPLVSIVPLQLLSYFIADRRGCDVDQPRNLAKSVTVE